MQNNLVQTATIWGILKILTVIRLVSGTHRNFVSQHSAFQLSPPKPGAP